MWVKGERTEEDIRLYWQPVTEFENGVVRTINANGETESEVPQSKVEWKTPYRLAGIIPLDDPFVEFCGVQFYDRFASAVMIHASRLIAGGWGDTPEDVVDWFCNLGDRMFVNGAYEFIPPGEDPFVDLKGCLISTSDEDGRAVATLAVNDDKYTVDIEDEEILTAFLLSTIPAI